MNCPRVEYGRDVEVMVDVVEIIITDNAVHLCWDHFPCAVVDGRIRFLPPGWTADLTVESVVGVPTVREIVQTWINLFKKWRIHPVGSIKREHCFVVTARGRVWFG